MVRINADKMEGFTAGVDRMGGYQSASIERGLVALFVYEALACCQRPENWMNTQSGVAARAVVVRCTIVEARNRNLCRVYF